MKAKPELKPFVLPRDRAIRLAAGLTKLTGTTFFRVNVSPARYIVASLLPVSSGSVAYSVSLERLLLLTRRSDCSEVLRADLLEIANPKKKKKREKA